MKITENDGYWASLIKQVRTSLSMSQESFAEAIFSNQATVSRWEKGLIIPTYDKQAKIEKMAAEANIISLGGLVEVIRNSPHRMLLIDQNHFIIAASSSSEWEDSKYIKDQLSNEGLKEYERISKLLMEKGFWLSEGGKRIDSSFNDGKRSWLSVITSITIRNLKFGIVQQVVTEVESEF